MSKELLALASAIKIAAVQLQISAEEVIASLSPNAAKNKSKSKTAPVEEEVEEEMEEVESKFAKGKGKKSPPKEEVAEEVTEDEDDMFGDDAEEDNTPTLEDVRKVVKDFATKHGKEKALKLLGKFKVTSIPDIKKTDYAKVIELAKKHL